ncbi:MAG: anthranilate phosphoribosyltransferase [Acidimicrobiia bacterium]
MGLSWPDVLDSLLDGDDLDAPTAQACLAEVIGGGTDPLVTAAFLTALRAKGETAEEVAGLARSMREHAVRVPVPGDAPLLDTCGTGGDRCGTVNVSTMAALVCAGAGVRVAKHGNRAASSACGSADVLEALGVRIELPPEGVLACLEEANIGFFFAPAYHPAMKAVNPVRRALGVRTVFNLLGPLANPAGVTRQVIGVPAKDLGELVAHALAGLGAVRAFVVHGADGLDELSTTGANEVWEIRDGGVHHTVLDSEDLGLARGSLDDLRGGDAGVNATVARATLDGRGGAVRDIVLLNAAAGLVAADAASGWHDALELASASIDSGAAAGCLERMVEVSNRSEWPVL